MTDYFEVPERKAYYKFLQRFSNINDQNFTVEKQLDEELDLNNVSLKDMIKNCKSIILKHPEYTNIVLECTRGYEGDPDSFYLLGHRKMTPQEKEELVKVLPMKFKQDTGIIRG